MNAETQVKAILNVYLTDPYLNWTTTPYEHHHAFRRGAPVHRMKQPPETPSGMIGNPGYGAITRHEDVTFVSKNSTFLPSRENGAIIRHLRRTDRAQIEGPRLVSMNQDDPEHISTVRMVRRGFTTKAMKVLTGILQERSWEIVTVAAAKGEDDFIADIANPLHHAIADLLGTPVEDHERLLEWSNAFVGGEDPEFARSPQQALIGYAGGPAVAHKAAPQDDIVTTLVNADKDGRGLTDGGFAFFIVPPPLVGNVTARNTMAHGIHALLRTSDQWERWKRERPSTMVEEMIRWRIPSRRSVGLHWRTPRSVEFRSPRVIGLFYASADCDVQRFVLVRRHPQPQSAPCVRRAGARSCLWAALVRLAIWLIFDQLADRASNITVLAEPVRLFSNYLNGIKEFQVSYSGAPRA